ncbi:PREDICTED: tetraspanin-6-like isoform X1 [Papilio xuthus]|uniref:Tetraspanin-6-like isoform X1 n=2 Tax=Papilio xuthus TaxID=66420 RepID=A0AAJ7EHL7_PAPXU|nr:PREDICTED: tetraspanin-6-like isoform X1 [Papilio xuthus]
MVANQNHPFVLWGACFLWFISMLCIIWSLLLFFFVGNILVQTGTDLVNAFVLLSGIITLPTNVHILYSIAYGIRVELKSKVMCCPLWFCIIWIIVINAVGIVLCIKVIHSCEENTVNSIGHGMKYYRSIPKYKNFIDNVQWSLHCCGLNSYKDWFKHEWYDKIRDYEWDPFTNRQTVRSLKEATDSVPLSCCKSGSCISNFLTELGTYSINTAGCGHKMYHIIRCSMYAHLFLFTLVILIEILMLKFIARRDDSDSCKKLKNNVQRIMSVNNNFEASSSSYQVNPEDSEDLELSREYEKD